MRQIVLVSNTTNLKLLQKFLNPQFFMEDTFQSHPQDVNISATSANNIFKWSLHWWDVLWTGLQVTNVVLGDYLVHAGTYAYVFWVYLCFTILLAFNRCSFLKWKGITVSKYTVKIRVRLANLIADISAFKIGKNSFNCDQTKDVEGFITTAIFLLIWLARPRRFPCMWQH